jgi:S-adenosyl-L-methionine hydrolase (adenosine-forming)
VTSSANTIALLTDFGYRDHYAGVMHGVIAKIAPAAKMIDLTHGIPPQQIAAGALVLSQSWRFFPSRTIFLAVVDPGVGTERKAIAIDTRAGARFVGPDNGLLFPAAVAAGIKRIVELQSRRHRLPEVSATFHGRDIFAPAAAWLARGVAMDQLGPALKQIVRLEFDGKVKQDARTLAGEVIYVDTFGNLITNLSRTRVDRFGSDFRQCRLSVRIRNRTPVGIFTAYGDEPAGVPLATFGSFDLLEIAVRDGSAAEHFAAGAGTPVKLRAERR